MKTATAFLAAALLLVGCAALAREPGQTLPVAGATAPDIRLPLVGGGEFSLAAARAEGPVVLVFYRAHW